MLLYFGKNGVSAEVVRQPLSVLCMRPQPSDLSVKAIRNSMAAQKWQECLLAD